MREMRDSGVAWIGEIPEDWKIIPLKYAVEKHFSGSWGKDPEYNTHDCICLRVADFDYSRLRFSKKSLQEYTIRNYTSAEFQTKILQTGDLILEKSGGGEKTPVGRAVLFSHKFPALVSNFCHVLRFKKNYDANYACFVLSAIYAKGITRDYMSQTTGIQNISIQDFLRTLCLPVPFLDEQKKIAKYLDAKCSEINDLITDINSQIHTLEQYRRSVITEAVTQGLNPNVEMKDSGIEWVGKIPKHWNIKPIRAGFEEVTQKNSREVVKKALKFTYGKIVKKNSFDADTDDYVARTILNYTVVSPGTIILNGLNLNYDFVSQRIGLVKEVGAITSAYLAFRPMDGKIDSEFATYLLKAYDSQMVFHNMGSGIRRTLNFSELKRQSIVYPTLEEQRHIVSFLDAKCAEIDAIITQKQEQLATLEAYKKSLIFEYVTGKKEVPQS